MRITYRLQDIPEKDVRKLANVLQFRPREDHQEAETRIKSNIKTLPWRLRGPGRLIRFLCPSRIDACQWHNGINRCIADVVLHHVQLEVGFRLNNLVAHSNLLQDDQLDRIWRLRELHALWLDPDTFAETFRISPHWIKWDYQANKCDACILSRISGNLEILLDLRCMIKSRATSKFVAKHGDPKLLKWVMTWIETMLSFVEESTGQRVTITDQIEINDRRSGEFKRLRAKIHVKGKKQKTKADQSNEKQNSSNQPSSHDLPDVFTDQGEEVVASKKARSTHFNSSEIHEHVSDDDLSAIDSYAALKSSLTLPMPTVNDDDARSAMFNGDHKSISSPSQQPRVQGDQESAWSNPRAQWKKGASRIYPHAATYVNPESVGGSKATAWDSVVFGSQYASGFDGNAHASGVGPRSGIPSKQTSSSYPAASAVDGNATTISSARVQERKPKPSSDGDAKSKNTGSSRPVPVSSAPSTCYSSRSSSSRDTRTDQTAATSARSSSSYGPCYPPLRAHGRHAADSYLQLMDPSPFAETREAPAFQNVSYGGRKDSRQTQFSSGAVSPTTKPTSKPPVVKPRPAHRENPSDRRRQGNGRLESPLTKDFMKELEQLERDLSPHEPGSSRRRIRHGDSQETVGTSILNPSSSTLSPESRERLTPSGLRPGRKSGPREQPGARELKESKQQQQQQPESRVSGHGSVSFGGSRRSATPGPKASTHRGSTPYGDQASSRMRSQATGWSDGYGAGLKEGDDMQWYYRDK